MSLYITTFSSEECKKRFLRQSSPIPSPDYMQNWVLKENEGRLIIMTKTTFWSYRVLYPYKQLICSMSDRENGAEVNVVFKINRQGVKKIMIYLFIYWLAILRPISSMPEISTVVVLVIQFAIFFTVVYRGYYRANKDNEMRLLEYITDLLKLKPYDTKS